MVNKFKYFLLFDETLQVNKFKNADLKFHISFLKSQPKIPNQDNFGPKFKVFCFWTKLYLKKFESADVKNVIILINSVSNKDKNHYYYNIFLENCSNKESENALL